MKNFDEFLSICEKHPSLFSYDAVSSIPSKDTYRGFPTSLTEADMILLSKMQVEITKKMLRRYHEWLTDSTD